MAAASESLRQVAAGLFDQLVRDYPLSYSPCLVWKKLRVSAGMAYPEQGQIALSTVVLRDEPAVRDTLIHEYAHLLAVDRYGRSGRGHGMHWRRTMEELGSKPVVRHRYDVVRNTARQRVLYRCAKCGHVIERTKRLPRRRRYAHVACGGEVKFVRAELTVSP